MTQTPGVTRRRAPRGVVLVTAIVAVGGAFGNATLAARAATTPSPTQTASPAPTHARGLLAVVEQESSTGGYGQQLIAGCAWATWVANCSNLAVYGNGNSFDDTGCGAPNGCTFGLEFQCNELAQRYAYYAWGEPPVWDGYGNDQGAAYQMWSAAPHLPVPLEQFANGGGNLPRVGDLLIFDQGWLGSYWDGAGHVAIISNVNVSSGYVDVVEQNATSTGTDQFALSGTTITAYGYTPIIGWLRPAEVSQLPQTENTTSFNVTWSPPTPGGPPASYYVLWVQDNGGRWVVDTTTTATSATVFGFPSHTYGFYIEAVGSSFDTGPPNMTQTSTSVAANATSSLPFESLYAVRGNGLLQPVSSPVLPSSTVIGNLARGISLDGSGQGGVVLDGWGGLHPFGDLTSASGAAWWPNWDIATGVALNSQNQGYVLDGWGGVHPFATNGGTAPPQPQANRAYWTGWKIARSIALFADGSGGVVLDGWGGVHPFTVGGAISTPAQTAVSPYWRGFDIARAIALLPGSTATRYGGYVLDGFGGIHPFGTAGDVPPAVAAGAYWSGLDVARGLVLLSNSPGAGYVVDATGAVFPFGGAPTVLTPLSTPGQNLTQGLALH